MIRNSRNTKVALAVLVGGAAVIGALQVSSPSAQTAPPIKLGILASMTGGGSVIGASMDAGVRMAVQEINAAGGLLGRQISIVVGDTQSNPTIAASEARRLGFQEKVDLVIGPGTSQEVMPTLPVMTEAKIAQVSTGATVEITPKVGPYHFSVSANAETQGIALLDYAIDKLKAKSIVVLTDDGGQSKTGVIAIKQRAKERGITLVGEQEYRFRTDDMTPQLLSLRRQNPDVILFFTSTPEDTVKLLVGRQDLNWTVPVVGNINVTNYAVGAARTAGPNAFDNVVSEGFVGFTYCTGDPVGQSEYAKFAERLKAFAPGTYSKLPLQLVIVYYEAVKNLQAAAEGTRSTEGPKLAAWLEQNATSVKSIAGPQSGDKDNHFLKGPNMLVMIEKANEARADGLQKRVGC